MSKLFRSSMVVAVAIATTLLISSTRLAQANVDGLVQGVFADPSDFVFSLDKNGGCGSAFFHVKRTNENFKEVVAVILTAFALGKMVVPNETGCSGDRNIISHAWAHN